MRGFTLASGLVGGLFGATAGIGGFTFIYAKGGSYLGHDSAACANCHIMNEQYDGWIKSSHRAVAECNDCHAPHDVLGKYATKAMNGFRHSLAFTTGRFPEPVRITPGNRAITEAACRHCHDDVVEMMESGGQGHGGRDEDGVDCVRCHHSVGHPHLSPVAMHTGGGR